jgi:hypothetical protein
VAHGRTAFVRKLTDGRPLSIVSYALGCWERRRGERRREDLTRMATSKVLYESLRYTVTRRNDGSIQVTSKNQPEKARIFNTIESDILDAFHNDGSPGVDRLCERLLAESEEE